MSTGTRRPSLSRYPSVALERQSSITSHSSNAFFEEQEETSSSGRTTVAEKEGIWNTTRRKLTLVSLCLVYFAATASFAILSPFFPSEVGHVNYCSPKCRLRQVELERIPWPGVNKLGYSSFNRVSRATLIKNNRSKAYAVRKALFLHQFGPGSMAYRHVYFRVPKLDSKRSTQPWLYQNQCESSPWITDFFFSVIFSYKYALIPFSFVLCFFLVSRLRRWVPQVPWLV